AHRSWETPQRPRTSRWRGPTRRRRAARRPHEPRRTPTRAPRATAPGPGSWCSHPSRRRRCARRAHLATIGLAPARRACLSKAGSACKGSARAVLPTSPNPSYFGVRHDMLELVPAGVPIKRVLDVGCAAGATGRALAERLPGVEITGIELDEAAAER